MWPVDTRAAAGTPSPGPRGGTIIAAREVQPELPRERQVASTSELTWLKDHVERHSHGQPISNSAG